MCVGGGACHPDTEVMIRIEASTSCLLIGLAACLCVCALREFISMCVKVPSACVWMSVCQQKGGIVFFARRNYFLSK